MLGNPSTHFFILIACNSNISHFKSNNLVKKHFKAMTVKITKKMNTKQTATAIAKVLRVLEKTNLPETDLKPPCLSQETGKTG